MTKQDLINLRLNNLQLTHRQFSAPEKLVEYLGAVQAQDFIGAKWALGLRIPGSTDKEIEKPFNEGKILRTHALRPTWHFVTPEDIRWIVELNAPQVKRIMGYYNKMLELNDDIFLKSQKIIATALAGKNLTRAQLQEELKNHGISGTGQRIGHIIMWAELDGLICSGPRIGKQFSYALIDDVAPKVKKISRDEALAKLTKIFFTSRGPATIKDFSKWSGLTIADSNNGLNEVKSQFQSEEIDGKLYHFSNHPYPSSFSNPSVFLLPNYDEYISSYTDYSILADLEKAKNLESKGNAIFWNHLIIDGRIEGSWRRTFEKNTVVVALSTIRTLSKEEMNSVEKATEEFANFLQMNFKLKLIK